MILVINIRFSYRDIKVFFEKTVNDFIFMHNYKELDVWKRSIDLSVYVYKQITINFPKHDYRLTNQVNSCSVSIPSNIAEGAGRKSKKEFSHFLSISIGSSCEFETQIIIANKIGYVSDEKFEYLTNEIALIKNKLYRLQQYIEKT